MSSCTDPARQRSMRWWRRAAPPARWSRLAREIGVVLVVKSVLLTVIVKTIAPAPSPRPSVEGGIERHLLGADAPPNAARGTHDR